MNRPAFSMPALAYAVVAPASIEAILRLREWIIWLDRSPVIACAIAALIVIATLARAWIVWIAAYPKGLRND